MTRWQLQVRECKPGLACPQAKSIQQAPVNCQPIQDSWLRRSKELLMGFLPARITWDAEQATASKKTVTLPGHYACSLQIWP